MERTSTYFAESVGSKAQFSFEDSMLVRSGDGRKTLSLAEQIAWQIGKSILEDKYQPGEALTEQSLSSEFKVSRGPVREALRILERERLVEIVPRRGARVTHLSAREVSEIFDIRAILLGHAARLAAEGESAECLEVLTAGHKILADNVAGDDDLDIHFTVSYQMNYALAAGTGNKQLYEIIFHLARQVARYTRVGLSSHGQRARSVQTWEKLIELIRNGRGDEAEALERQRVREVQELAISSLMSTETRVA
ncbi:MAG: GntR family transcriptional regulator [Alphaproteobacteria bacterium]|nr:GntR family transcriptional regulator [Alphaproteobacteria bacterium]MCY4496147.1 GntR family transcriptional regulator [Rhodospirillaceae bacterium]